jgi:hypothetical protein
MGPWLWWIIGGVATYYFNVHQQRQSALQAIDIGLLMIQASSAQAASQATAGTPIQSAAGSLAADANLPANISAQAHALSTSTLAPNWLALATALQSEGYPLLAHSVATLGMTLLEGGQLNLT